MEIKVLHSTKINQELWDKCVEQSQLGLPYAQYWMLECLHKNWFAIILNNYDAVLPLPFKNRMGIKIGRQAIWAQQLGIFSKQPLQNEVQQNLWKKAFKTLNITHYKINESNNYLPLNFNINQWQNLALNLNKSYNELASNFNSNTKRNLKKFEKSDLEINYSQDINFLLNTYKKYQLPKLKGIKEHQLLLVKKVIEYALANKKGFIVCAKNSKGKNIAACFYLETNKRIVHFFPAQTDEGREQAAMFGIVNHIIKTNCNQNKLLDFEGSMVESIARFYKGFGAEIEPYYELYNENLNWWQNLIWKITN